MGYVIAAILVVLIGGGFVLFLVTNATGADDETAAGDTRELADADEGSSVDERATDDGADVARPVVGGEAEGKRSSG
jgi:hypothetical protein